MRRPLLFALLFAATRLVQADWGQFESDYEEPAKAWQEIESQLPAFPQDANLIPFDVSATARHQYFIDYPSVSVGEDGVVRFTVVVRTRGGAENVSFEGMRCTTGEHKLYAFGHRKAASGEWSRNRHARWIIVKDRANNSYQRELFTSYFCAGGMGEPDLGRVQRLLKNGGYKPM